MIAQKRGVRKLQALQLHPAPLGLESLLSEQFCHQIWDTMWEQRKWSRAVRDLPFCELDMLTAAKGRRCQSCFQEMLLRKTKRNELVKEKKKRKN